MESEAHFLGRCKRLLKQGAHSSIALSVERRIRAFDRLKKCILSKKVVTE